MPTAQYLTSWIGDGSQDTPYRAAMSSVPGIESLQDVTGQQGVPKVPGPGVYLIAEPNVFVVEVKAIDSVLDLIVVSGAVELWRE